MTEVPETAGRADEATLPRLPTKVARSMRPILTPATSRSPVRPFENLPTLPADLRDAFDGFKLAIIHHRISNWQEVSREDVLATLEALRQLTLAPAEA